MYRTQEILPAIDARFAELLRRADDLDKDWAHIEGMVHDLLRALDASTAAKAAHYSPMSRGDGLSEGRRNLVRRVVAIVAKHLSVAGVSLDIDSAPIVEHFLGSRRSWEEHKRPEFSCRAVMLHTLEIYQDKADVLVRKQAALSFAHAFGLKHQKNQEMKGCALLEINAGVDVYWRPARFTTSTQGRLSTALLALGAVIALTEPMGSGPAALAEAEALIAELSAANWVPERSFRGHAYGVEVRLFQSCIKFLVPRATVARLNAFVSQHAPEYFQEPM